MNRFLVAILGAAAIAASARGLTVTPLAQGMSASQSGAVLTIAAMDAPELSQADSSIERMIHEGDLRLRERRDDLLIPDDVHERYEQYYAGLRVFGANVLRQRLGAETASVFGSLYTGITLNPEAGLSKADAIAAIERDGMSIYYGSDLELLVLPVPASGYRLAYMAQTLGQAGPRYSFLDATTGEFLLHISARQTQAAVGAGKGVLGDDKKVSATASGGTYLAQDSLRPPALLTFDMKGIFSRVDAFLSGRLALGTSDLASKSDNKWTDGAAVDAHVYEGWVYDYYYKRFQRKGLDDNNARIVGLVHPVPRELYAIASDDLKGTFYLNAFYNDFCRCMVYGEGLPPGTTITAFGTRVSVTYFSGALDIVGHELTHAVTFATSRLTYLNESGALNEAFSDIMGTSIEFFYQPAGSGPLKADYLIGEDIISPLAPGMGRSLATPADYLQPDHYALRAAIGNSFDNGGVHVNSGIANHAFYLAIEGGRNRFSGRTVQGVGAANREQIEKVFYRAFTSMLPSNATMYIARLATIQSARDLYGAGSAPERAVTQAWDAVGVTSPAGALTTTFSPNPVPASNPSCGGTPPSFAFTATVSEFQGVGFSIAGFLVNFFDSQGRALGELPGSARDFATLFNSCGTGSTRIAGGSRACANVCASLGGRTGGFITFTFEGTDDNGNPGTFESDAVRLGAGTSFTGDTGLGVPTLTAVRPQ